MQFLFNMRFLFTIEQCHVGLTRRTRFGANSKPVLKQAALANQALGYIRPVDVGKRVFESANGVIYVENEFQRDARIQITAQKGIK